MVFSLIERIKSDRQQMFIFWSSKQNEEIVMRKKETNQIANERNDPFFARTIALIVSTVYPNQTIRIECRLSRINYASFNE